MNFAYYYKTELGTILITEDADGITGLSLITDLLGHEPGQISDQYKLKETELIREAFNQVTEYLNGNRKIFELKLHPVGTEFQKKVWKALQEIPYGETRSYGQIAAFVGNEKASRAVGMANHNNPILLVIPCHRVIGSNGKLVGFGAGLDVKEHLLGLEKTYK